MSLRYETISVDRCTIAVVEHADEDAHDVMGFQVTDTGLVLGDARQTALVVEGTPQQLQAWALNVVDSAGALRLPAYVTDCDDDVHFLNPDTGTYALDPADDDDSHWRLLDELEERWGPLARGPEVFLP